MSDIERAGTSGDPEQIGKTGGRPKSVASVRKLLGKALGKGWMKRADKGFGRGTSKANSGNARGFKQRVIVKALVVKQGRQMVGGKRGSGGRGQGVGGASLARHVRYLGRDGTSEMGERGQFYDRAAEGLDADQLTKSWHDHEPGDRHHFRLIISPENGAAIDDLKGYIQHVIERVENDRLTICHCGGREGRPPPRQGA